jgi:hypothetical protein
MYEVRYKSRKHTYKKSEAVRELEKLADAEARRKHPDMPYLPARKYRDDTSNGLTKCVIDFLKLSGYQAERIGCTGRFIDCSKVVTDITDSMIRIGQGRWVYGSGQRGTADISATIRGRSVKIEVKIRDRQSPDQKAYQQAVESAGGLYWLVQSFDEFKQLLATL